MRRRLSILLCAAFLMAVISLAPAASGQLGVLDCRQCTKICWTGFIFTSCDHFCVSYSPTTGYEECNSGEGWCQQWYECVQIIV